MFAMKPEWRLKLRLFAAKLMIKFGKLKHAEYSSAELKEIIDKYLPIGFKIDVPVGKGDLTLLEAQISMPKNCNVINIEILGSIIIGPVGSPIYRAHLIVKLEAHPIYEPATNTVSVDKVLVADMQLVNDEYAIIEDSRDLLSLLFPRPLQNLLSGTVKSAFGLMTGGVSDVASNYLKLYLSGSKQRVFDYHRPQIETLVNDFAKTDALRYELDPANFEEQLFCLYGKEVAVEDGLLRFKF